MNRSVTISALLRAIMAAILACALTLPVLATATPSYADPDAGTTMTLSEKRTAIATTAVALSTGNTRYKIHGATSKRTANACKAYNAAHDKVIGTKSQFPIYASCDYAVCTVMRSSGVDPSYPRETVQVQKNYLKKSAKWQYVGKHNDKSGKGVKLKPGDVLIYTKAKSKQKGLSTGHTKLYVGNKAVKAAYPKAKSNVVWFEASYKHYYPWVFNKKQRKKAHPKNTYHTYQVYRLVA